MDRSQSAAATSNPPTTSSTGDGTPVRRMTNRAAHTAAAISRTGASSGNVRLPLETRLRLDYQGVLTRQRPVAVAPSRAATVRLSPDTVGHLEEDARHGARCGAVEAAGWRYGRHVRPGAPRSPRRGQRGGGALRT